MPGGLTVALGITAEYSEGGAGWRWRGSQRSRDEGSVRGSNRRGCGPCGLRARALKLELVERTEGMEGALRSKQDAFLCLGPVAGVGKTALLEGVAKGSVISG